jgi:hypothetical protein
VPCNSTATFLQVRYLEQYNGTGAGSGGTNAAGPRNVSLPAAGPLRSLIVRVDSDGMPLQGTSQQHLQQQAAATAARKAARYQCGPLSLDLGAGGGGLGSSSGLAAPLLATPGSANMRVRSVAARCVVEVRFCHGRGGGGLTHSSLVPCCVVMG